MSLVRFSYSETPLVALRNKIRHMYDLHQPLGQAELLAFFDSEAFGVMLHQVGRDDAVSFRDNKDWLYVSPANALLFADLDRVWPALQPTYHGSFKNLVFGAFPSDEAVLQTLRRIKGRLGLLNWTLKP